MSLTHSRLLKAVEPASCRRTLALRTKKVVLQCDLTSIIVQSRVDGYSVCGFPFNFSRAAR